MSTNPNTTEIEKAVSFTGRTEEEPDVYINRDRPKESGECSVYLATPQYAIEISVSEKWLKKVGRSFIYAAKSIRKNKERELRIQTIVGRAMKAIPDSSWSEADLMQALAAAQTKGCGVNLGRLAASAKIDLVYDINGIMDTFDPTTGEITGRFVPKCASIWDQDFIDDDSGINELHTLLDQGWY